MKITKSIGQWDRIGMWEDPFYDPENPVPEDTDFTIYEWLGYDPERINRYIANGFEVIRNDCWYLDYISYGEKEWEKYHNCKLYESYGGEISMWSEYIESNEKVKRKFCFSIFLKFLSTPRVHLLV